jgi:hypothetical protein
MEAVSEETRRIRQKIVDTAKHQVTLGAHYMFGCYGAIPGGSDNVRNRRLELGHETSWDRLAIRSAQHSNVGRVGLIGCPGKFGTGRGRAIDAALQRRIREYIADNSSLPSHNWPSFEGMGYPRRAWDEFSDSHIYVLGESCEGKRHFDCIGFVNWAITQVLNRRMTYNIDQWANARVAPVTVRTTVDQRHAAPGDILIRGDSHIALVESQDHLLEAAGIRVGVVRSAFTASRFTAHARIRNRWLARFMGP